MTVSNSQAKSLPLPEANQRVLGLIDKYSEGNVSAFAASLKGVSTQSLNRIFNIDVRTKKYPSVSASIVTAITRAYPEVDIGWLLHGLRKQTAPQANEKQFEPTPMQILDRLTAAFADQAKAMADQAEAFRTQAEIMKSIEGKMAQSETQKTILANLSDVRQVVDKISEGQNKAVNRFLKEFDSLQNKVPSKVAGKRKVGDGSGV